MAFVKQIYEVFVANNAAGLSRQCLRNKNSVDPLLTDQQLFSAMLLGDCWEDASLPSVYFYLRSGKHLVIPNSWQAAIDAFDEELSKNVFGWR